MRASAYSRAYSSRTLARACITRRGARALCAREGGGTPLPYPPSALQPADCSKKHTKPHAQNRPGRSCPQPSRDAPCPTPAPLRAGSLQDVRSIAQGTPVGAAGAQDHGTARRRSARSCSRSSPGSPRRCRAAVPDQTGEAGRSCPQPSLDAPCPTPAPLRAGSLRDVCSSAQGAAVGAAGAQNHGTARRGSSRSCPRSTTDFSRKEVEK